VFVSVAAVLCACGGLSARVTEAAGAVLLGVAIHGAVLSTWVSSLSTLRAEERFRR
jgi:hypothetical protein